MLNRAEPEFISIGEFARRTRLTAKALRLYDRIGLLRPAAVDPHNGYRRYAISQVRAGQLIGLLRGAHVGLPEIGDVLHDVASQNGALAVQRLERLLAAGERTQAHRKQLIRHIQATLESGRQPIEPGGQPMFPIQTRSVPACRVMSMQRRLHASETGDFARYAKASFIDHLQGAAATGPFTLIFHGVVDHENDGPLEAILGCPDEIEPTDVIGVRTEPAHEEAYTTITKAQWAYPEILAAYDAVACSPEATARPGTRLSCREVYLAAPDDVGDEDPICDVAFPLGEP